MCIAADFGVHLSLWRWSGDTRVPEQAGFGLQFLVIPFPLAAGADAAALGSVSLGRFPELAELYGLCGAFIAEVSQRGRPLGSDWGASYCQP